MEKLRQLAKELDGLPFPERGRRVGNFGLFDGLLSGQVSSVIEGVSLHPNQVVDPDEESVSESERIRGSVDPSHSELEYLRYFALLMQARAELVRVCARA